MARVAGSKKSVRKIRKHNGILNLKLVKQQDTKAIESDILGIKDISLAEEISLVEGDKEDAIDLSGEIEAVETKDKVLGHTRDMLEQIMFRLPCVPDPLIGSPQQVQSELDALAKKMQKHPKNNHIFDKIHLYMHGYLINVVLKKFPFIRGLQTVDVYQETLIALRFKAIPNFEYGKGMSFLNFAKMCIRRHLITLLNTSKHRIKDKAINQAISLDSSSNREEDDGSKTTYANVIADTKVTADKNMETNEAYEVTRDALLNILSDFERLVLAEYLANSSYREISKSVSKFLKKRTNTKSIDNALLRIKKKAMHLMKYSGMEELPIFLPKKTA